MKRRSYGARQHGHKTMRKQVQSLKKKLDLLIDKQKEEARMRDYRVRQKLKHPRFQPNIKRLP